MKKIKYIILIILVLMLVGCDNKPVDKEKKIEIESTTHLELGETVLLTNNLDNENAVYSTIDPNVEINGRYLTGIKLGTADINCTIGNNYITFTVTILSPNVGITITGKDAIVVGESTELVANLSKTIDKKYSDEVVTWYCGNTSVATIDDTGIVTGVAPGDATIICEYFINTVTYKIKVLDKDEKYISMNIRDTININEAIVPGISIYGTAETEYIITSSNENIVKVQGGALIGVSAGTCIITASLKNDSSVKVQKEITVTDSVINMKIEGEQTMMQGKYNYLSVKFEGEKSETLNKDVTWESSDKRLALVNDEGVVLAVNKGNVVITATSKANPELKATYPININKYVSTEEYSAKDIQRVEAIMNNMTLKQKVGQMFFIGFSGTEYSKVLDTAISNCSFGNIIYMGGNVKDPDTLGAMSNQIQQKMVSTNTVPAFISTDQEGGRVARLQTKATHFVSAMAVAASNNLDNAYELGKGMGFELKHYGINMDLAPVVDVNNNPENPIIGNRSYSDDPMTVAMFGNKVFMGLEESGVVGCVKHFPGHGNTNVDSHTGLPVITSTKDELYQTELAPFISSIANGVGAIMTTHIIFTAIDKDYPATLSYKVLTNLLREELGYTGLIVTDGMGMAGVNQNYGTYEEIAVRAVKAGVDIFCYTGNDIPQRAHAGIIEAINKGDISVDRINESVKRILLAKLKYGVLDNYLTTNSDISAELEKNAELNYKIGQEAITMVKGDFKIDKNDKVLFISVDSGYKIDGVTEDTVIKSNSLACYAATYLQSKGFKYADYYTTSNPITTKEHNELLAKIKNYDKVVVGFSNVKTTNETPSINFMNAVADAKKENLLAVALNTPYDLLAYNKNVTNYCCIYCNQNATIVGFAKVMAGEVEATGVSPIDEDLFK